jgi:hypothetical protein
MVIIVQERGGSKHESVVTGYGGTAGTGVDLCGFPFDSGDDVDADADDNLIIDFDSDLVLATLHTTIPQSSPRDSLQIFALPPRRSNQPCPSRPSLA